MLKILKLSNVSDDNVWFVSDLHLCHNPRWRPTLFQQRGFNTIEEHDKFVIDKINELVKPTDHLFLLGDFTLNSDDKTAENLLFKIKANKHLIWGNHESQVSKVYKRYLTYTFPYIDFNEPKNRNLEIYPLSLNNITFYGSYLEIVINNVGLVLSHFPFTIWNNCKDGWFNLHGHCHGNFPESRPDALTHKRLDVSFDVFKEPINLGKVKQIMSNKQFVSLDHHA